MHIEKVLRQGQLVDKELELEEILAWLSDRLLHGGLRGDHRERHIPPLSLSHSLFVVLYC